MIRTLESPAAGQRWLSCPPYLMLARVVDVDRRCTPASISYELVDEDGSVLYGPIDAVLDDGWFRTFQPLLPRWG